MNKYIELLGLPHSMVAGFPDRASQENKAKNRTFYDLDLEVTEHYFATETSLVISVRGDTDHTPPRPTSIDGRSVKSSTQRIDFISSPLVRNHL